MFSEEFSDNELVIGYDVNALSDSMISQENNTV